MYSRASTAELLRVDEADVQWLIDTGQLTPVGVGGEVFILGRDIDELLLVYEQIQKRSEANGK